MSGASKPPVSPRARRSWIAHLWRECAIETRRPILPVAAHPEPHSWSDRNLTASWLGHATVLINFYGVNILTDPVLFPRIGVRFPGFTIGPKRLTAPALTVKELPRIDLILLSHAHFDHFDLRTLQSFTARTAVVTPPSTSDLLRFTKLREVTELRWHESIEHKFAAGALRVSAFPVQHWGARLQRDYHRGYNGYVIERNGRRVIFGGDSALTENFAPLRKRGPVDLAIMAIGAYEPWIRSHATPEQAIGMANDAGARFIMPVHHQTFRLSFEPFHEPIERFAAALAAEPRRIALRGIGETFVLPD